MLQKCGLKTKGNTNPHQNARSFHFIRVFLPRIARSWKVINMPLKLEPPDSMAADFLTYDYPTYDLRLIDLRLMTN
jgi:hypothetical protein